MRSRYAGGKRRRSTFAGTSGSGSLARDRVDLHDFWHARHLSNLPRPYTNLIREVVSQIIGTGGIAILTDQMFGWEMREWARAMSTVSSPAYLYYFSRAPPAPDAGRMGAYHTAEIPYVFDNLGVNPDPAQHRDYDDTDRVLSDQMASYWVNFAATGDPNGEGLPEWPAYDAVSDTALEFGDAIVVRSGIRKARLDLSDRFYAAQRGTP